MSVELVDMTNVSGNEILARLANDEINGETIQYYGIKLTSTNHTALVEFRNSSNGYYGGDVTEVECKAKKT